MSSGDESDQDLLVETGVGISKASTLYCIDAGPSMHEINPDSIGKVDEEQEDLGQTHLTMAVNGVIQRVKRMLITNPDDNVGIMLYNTAESDIQSHVGKAKASRHCKVLMPISQVGIQSISDVLTTLERIRDDGQTWSDLGYAPHTKDPAMDRYIKNAWLMLKPAGKTLRNCVIITNRDDPYGPGRQDDATSKTLTAMREFSRFNIRWALYAISYKGYKFDNNKFWSYVFSDHRGDDSDDEKENDAEDDHQSEVIMNAATTFDKFQDDISTKQAAKRTAFSLSMTVGGDNGITCDINGYALIAEAYKRSPIKLYKDPENPTETEKVQPLHYFQCQDTGTTLANLDEDTEKVFEFGSTSGVKGHASLSTDCIANLKSSGMEAPQLRILGFRDPDSLLRRELSVKHSYFLFPNTNSATNVRIFSALFQSMESKNRAALGILKMKKNSNPIFCAIIAQKGKDEPITPEGLSCIPLPFVDDIRSFPAPKKNSYLTLSATDEQTSAMSKVASKLTLKRNFDPHSYKNPALVYQDLVLLACAFGNETPDPPVDEIAPNHEVIEVLQKRASEPIADFNDLLYKDERTAGSSKNLRARVRKQHEAGLLSRMRVDELKEACKAYALPSSGRKDQLIERIDQHLS